MVAPWDPKNPVRESVNDRVWVATQRNSYRLERDWHDDSGASRISLSLSDGVTRWSPTASGAFYAHPADPAAFPARTLLDPSWLVGYDWDTPRPDTHAGRAILVIRARRENPPSEFGESNNPRTASVLRLPPPEEAEVLVDAEYGFLHRMTGIVGGEPFVVNELLDLVVDAPVEEEMFRVDPANVVVLPEMEVSEAASLGSFRASPEPPRPAWSDLGAIAEILQDDLDNRAARLPLRRLRKWSDTILLQAVESEHVDRLARKYSLSGPERAALQTLWFDRIDAELEETLDQLRYDIWTRERRIRRRLRNHHLIDQLWFNTFGPGGETWFADHLPIRRFRFRLHWRP